MNPWRRKTSHIFSSDAVTLFINLHNKSNHTKKLNKSYHTYNPRWIYMSWEKHHSHSWTWNLIFSQKGSNIRKKASIYYILVSQPPKQREIKLFCSILSTQIAALQDKSTCLDWPPYPDCDQKHSLTAVIPMDWNDVDISEHAVLSASYKSTGNYGMYLMVWKALSAMERVSLLYTYFGKSL